MYSLVVVANGNSSDPVRFSFHPDALVIGPLTGFAASGPVGGPFSATTQSYMVTNIGSSSLSWSLLNTSLWLSVSASNGVLAAGGPAATVSVSLNGTTANLEEGTYMTVLTFSNLESGARQNLAFRLAVQPLVQNGGFEIGLAGWTSGSVSGNSPTAIADAHLGAYAAFLFWNASKEFLSQTVPTAPGERYLLSFWLRTIPAGIPRDNEFLVSWNGTNICDATNLVIPTWTNLVFTVTATAPSTTLEFTVQNDQATFFELDDVSVARLKPPSFRSIVRTGQSLALTWSAVPGRQYQLQRVGEPGQNEWSNVGNPITATNSTVAALEPIGPDRYRAYRVCMLP
jgi:hypothetical protein